MIAWKLSITHHKQRKPSYQHRLDTNRRESVDKHSNEQHSNEQPGSCIYAVIVLDKVQAWNNKKRFKPPPRIFWGTRNVYLNAEPKHLQNIIICSWYIMSDLSWATFRRHFLERKNMHFDSEGRFGKLGFSGSSLTISIYHCLEIYWKQRFLLFGSRGFYEQERLKQKWFDTENCMHSKAHQTSSKILMSTSTSKGFIRHKYTKAKKKNMCVT